MSSIESLVLHFIEMTNVSFSSMPIIYFSVMYKRLSFVVYFFCLSVCMLVALPTVMTLCALHALEACRAHRSQNLSDLTSV